MNIFEEEGNVIFVYGKTTIQETVEHTIQIGTSEGYYTLLSVPRVVVLDATTLGIIVRITSYALE